MTEQPQHMTALDLANKIRLERAALHRHVRNAPDFETSCVELARILDGNPPTAVGGMFVSELLQWTVFRRGMHKQRWITDTLRQAGCSEHRRVRELTARQRTVIVDALTSVAYGREMAA